MECNVCADRAHESHGRENESHSSHFQEKIVCIENNKLGCIDSSVWARVAYANVAEANIGGRVRTVLDESKRVKKLTLLSYFVPFSDDMNYILFRCSVDMHAIWIQ